MKGHCLSRSKGYGGTLVDPLKAQPRRNRGGSRRPLERMLYTAFMCTYNVCPRPPHHTSTTPVGAGHPNGPNASAQSRTVHSDTVGTARTLARTHALATGGVPRHPRAPTILHPASISIMRRPLISWSVYLLLRPPRWLERLSGLELLPSPRFLTPPPLPLPALLSGSRPLARRSSLRALLGLGLG